jgi:alkanesulfonate monooxygenase SsuD/methylene tetrahydromethanopterin reductase-like flavin-dependent oxidoreductase (luciferase family)
MKLALIQECDSPNGVQPPPSRYFEMVDEAQAAEQAGFGTYLVSEQHFNPTIATASSPESLLPYIAAKTSTIKLRVGAFVLLSFNHPIRVAERSALLDILTNGRFEIGTARSNNPETLAAFQLSPDQTRGQWEESIEIIRGLLMNEKWEHHGPNWAFPPITTMPRPITKPHPPIYAAASSLESHFNAGKYGLGVMTGNSLTGGWDYCAAGLEQYAKGIEVQDAHGGLVTESRGVLAAVAYCAETNEKAKERASEVAYRFVGLVAGWYKDLSTNSKDYKDMAGMKEVVDQRGDVQEMIDRSPYLTIGTPEFFLERCRRLADLGYNELICRIDGQPPEEIMATIDLLGREVIPVIDTW